ERSLWTVIGPSVSTRGGARWLHDHGSHLRRCSGEGNAKPEGVAPGVRVDLTWVGKNVRLPAQDGLELIVGKGPRTRESRVGRGGKVGQADRDVPRRPSTGKHAVFEKERTAVALRKPCGHDHVRTLDQRGPLVRRADQPKWEVDMRHEHTVRYVRIAVEESG